MRSNHDHRAEIGFLNLKDILPNPSDTTLSFAAQSFRQPDVERALKSKDYMARPGHPIT
jgi:hypothetical protein